MILVTVGMSDFPFDRLLHALDGLDDGGEPLVVQHGPSCVRPAGADCYAFFPFDVLRGFMAEARTILCHAGVGSVALALMQGTRPIVVPRLHRYGECVDDHQLAFARRLDRDGLVTAVEALETLADVVARAPAREGGVPKSATGGALLAEVHRYLSRRLLPAR